MKKKPCKQGFVMTGMLVFLLIGLLVAGSFVFVSRRSHPVVRQWTHYDQALLAAQTATEKIKADLYDGFNAAHQLSRSWNDLGWIVNNAASFSTAGTLSGILGTNVSYAYANAAITATVVSGGVVGLSAEERVVYVTNTVTAAFGGVNRTIEEVVRYKLNRSSVFDHAYFINNFGWFYGVDCVVNGDLRSNFDVELRSRNLILNGYSYAAGVNDINTPYTTWSWSTYDNDSKRNFFRPTLYVDQQRTITTGSGRNRRTVDNTAAYFEFGYDTAGTYNNVPPLEMPFIGNLNDYKYYAEENNGTIRTGSVIVVSNVFSGTGPSGFADAPDRGTVVLVGTAANPIRINGPVVVEGDVILKGFFTGQGTIYAGRNIHLIGDLIATNAPQWRQPDTASTFTNSTLPGNLTKDFMGLCAKGSIVIGDYRAFSSGHTQYMKPPFTDEYPVDPTDADIGYVSYARNGTNYFNGDYTAAFGTKCGNTVPTNGVSRKYYESSLSDTKLGSYSPQSSVERIDAFIYNNHLTAGRFSSDAMINGGIICRDEALLLSGRIYMNWDCRVALDSDFQPFLPLDLGPAETIQWREVDPGGS